MSFHQRDVAITGSSLTYVAGDQNNFNFQNSTQLEGATNARQTATPDGHLPRAISATSEFLDSADLARCLEGTREDVLKQVYHWINGDNKRTRKKNRPGEADAKEIPLIFWINGSAGTGKRASYFLLDAKLTLITEQVRRRSHTPLQRPAEQIKVLGQPSFARVIAQNAVILTLYLQPFPINSGNSSLRSRTKSRML
jgi:hypothetical protein